MSVKQAFAMVLVCTAFGAARASAALTRDDFLLRSTGDLVDLCSAPQTDPMYTAAINFCHGFAVGVYTVFGEEEAAHGSRRIFCAPDPQPTRSEAIANFVSWAKADPARLSQPPTDALAMYLAQQFPCRGRR